MIKLSRIIKKEDLFKHYDDPNIVIISIKKKKNKFRDPSIVRVSLYLKINTHINHIFASFNDIELSTEDQKVLVDIKSFNDKEFIREKNLVKLLSICQKYGCRLNLSKNDMKIIKQYVIDKQV